MDFIWGQKVSATDGWAGRLRGVVVSPAPMRVTHLTVQRGLVMATRRSAQVGLLVGGDTESLRLGLGLVEMLALPNADTEPPAGAALTPAHVGDSHPTGSGCGCTECAWWARFAG